MHRFDRTGASEQPRRFHQQDALRQRVREIATRLNARGNLAADADPVSALRVAYDEIGRELREAEKREEQDE